MKYIIGLACMAACTAASTSLVEEKIAHENYRSLGEEDPEVNT
jgi:hypothetical protein